MTRIAAAFALLLLVVPVGVAQDARVATEYVRVNVEPEFQYRSDQSVVIPVQVRVVRGGVPQGDVVHVEVRDTQGNAMDVQGGQDWLRDGVRPYPHRVEVNLGRQEPGLYRVVFAAWSNELYREVVAEYDVVYPPQGYEAALLGAKGKAARFVFEAHDEDHEFQVTMYRDAPTGRIQLTQVHTNRTVLEVPYVPGEAVKIDVEDEHGWRNARNKYTDWRTGESTYAPYVWHPDFKQIKNYQYQAWQEALTSGAVLLVVVVALYWVRRRSL